jgi:hypothetical protein
MPRAAGLLPQAVRIANIESRMKRIVAMMLRAVRSVQVRFRLEDVGDNCLRRTWTWNWKRI